MTSLIYINVTLIFLWIESYQIAQVSCGRFSASSVSNSCSRPQSVSPSWHLNPWNITSPSESSPNISRRHCEATHSLCKLIYHNFICIGFLKIKNKKFDQSSAFSSGKNELKLTCSGVFSGGDWTMPPLVKKFFRHRNNTKTLSPLCEQ